MDCFIKVNQNSRKLQSTPTIIKSSKFTSIIHIESLYFDLSELLNLKSLWPAVTKAKQIISENLLYILKHFNLLMVCCWDASLIVRRQSEEMLVQCEKLRYPLCISGYLIETSSHTWDYNNGSISIRRKQVHVKQLNTRTVHHANFPPRLPITSH